MNSRKLALDANRIDPEQQPVKQNRNVAAIVRRRPKPWVPSQLGLRSAVSAASCGSLRPCAARVLIRLVRRFPRVRPRGAGRPVVDRRGSAPASDPLPAAEAPRRGPRVRRRRAPRAGQSRCSRPSPVASRRPAVPERAWLWVHSCSSISRAHGCASRRAATDALPDGPFAEVLRAHARQRPRRTPRARLRDVRRRASRGRGRTSSRRSAYADAGGRPSAVRSAAERAVVARGRRSCGARRTSWPRARCSRRARAAKALALALRAPRRRTPPIPVRPRSPRGSRHASGRATTRPRPPSRRCACSRAAPAGGPPRRRPRPRRRGARPSRRACAPRSARCSRCRARPPRRRPSRGSSRSGPGPPQRRPTATRRRSAAGADPVPVDRHLRRLPSPSGIAWRRSRGSAAPSRPRSSPIRATSAATTWIALDRGRGRPRDGRRPPCPTRRASRTSPRPSSAVGALDEAVALLRRSRGPTRTRPTATTCAARSRFERAFRAAVEEGYRAPASGATPVPSTRSSRRSRARARAPRPSEEQAAASRPDGRPALACRSSARGSTTAPRHDVARWSRTSGGWAST